MVFSSTIFLFVFLPLVLIGYYLIRYEYRNYFLLVMSLAFYAYGEPRFVIAMIFSIIINFLCGLWMHRFSTSTLKRVGFGIALLLNFGLLFYYKYFDFFIRNVNTVFGTTIAERHIALPIGISFFTFQGLSYIFDLYLDKVGVQRNIFKFALFISLFPQLIAGPIVRYIDVANQIDERHVDVHKFASGIQKFIIGLAKKSILANSFATYADMAFGLQGQSLSVVSAWIGAIAYTFQIYFDFSGYSDMAIGLGRIFGFEFIENFNYPYISKTMTEFWRRWHISLSTWFRDYLYIPLGGNRLGKMRTLVNLAIVFFATGLWHGASWTFVMWGLWHGAFLILEKFIFGKNSNIERREEKYSIAWLYTVNRNYRLGIL